MGVGVDSPVAQVVIVGVLAAATRRRLTHAPQPLYNPYTIGPSTDLTTSKDNYQPSRKWTKFHENKNYASVSTLKFE